MEQKKVFLIDVHDPSSVKVHRSESSHFFFYFLLSLFVDEHLHISVKLTKTGFEARAQPTVTQALLVDSAPPFFVFISSRVCHGYLSGSF